MIPWLGFIQEHRNVYSLIPNMFYQKNYINLLENTVLEERCRVFLEKDANELVGEVGEVVMGKFDGAEIDFGN